MYLAIHSNAGVGGNGSGAVAFYHPDSEQGKVHATNLVNELNGVCPVKSNRWVSVVNGMEVFDGAGYGEVRNPTQNGLIGVLAETNFHDNPVTAEWIINNHDIIARAYVNGLVKTFNIKKKSVPQVPIKLYRVQIGAYSKKENAQAVLEKAKNAGFKDTFIRYE